MRWAGGFLLFLGAHLRWGWRAYRHLSLRFDGRRATGGSNAAAWNIGALAAVTCLLVAFGRGFQPAHPRQRAAARLCFRRPGQPGPAARPGGEPGRAAAPHRLPAAAGPAGAGPVARGRGSAQDSRRVFLRKARVALRDGHNAPCCWIATRGIEHEQENPTLYFYLGQARQNLAGNGPDEPIARSFRLAASEAYRAGLRLAPMDIYLLVHEGEMLTRLGDFEAAGEIFRRVKRLGSEFGLRGYLLRLLSPDRGIAPGGGSGLSTGGCVVSERGGHPQSAGTRTDPGRRSAVGMRTERAFGEFFSLITSQDSCCSRSLFPANFAAQRTRGLTGNGACSPQVGGSGTTRVTALPDPTSLPSS